MSGLRVLNFLRANIPDMFEYLKYDISFILAFVGVKMLMTVVGFPVSPGFTPAALPVSVPASCSVGKPAHELPEHT